MKRGSTRRLLVFDGLLMPRVWLYGPKWKRSFDVKEVRLGDLVPNATLPDRKILVWSFEADLREMLLDEIRPGVYAEWSDPNEWLNRSYVSHADNSTAAVRDAGGRSSRASGRRARNRV